MSAPVTYRARHSRSLPPSRGKGQLRLALMWLTLACGVMLPGCTEFPALTAPLTAADTDAPLPVLVPVDSILARTEDTAIQPDTQSGLEARMAGLEQRAARLRDAGLDPETRARMQAGVSEVTP